MLWQQPLPESRFRERELGFSEKGALDDFMGSSQFTLQIGLSLVYDMARCLKYLHHDLIHHVIHRDVMTCFCAPGAVIEDPGLFSQALLNLWDPGTGSAH